MDDDRLTKMFMWGLQNNSAKTWFTCITKIFKFVLVCLFLIKKQNVFASKELCNIAAENLHLIKNRIPSIKIYINKYAKNMSERLLVLAVTAWTITTKYRN